MCSFIFLGLIEVSSICCLISDLFICNWQSDGATRGGCWSRDAVCIVYVCVCDCVTCEEGHTCVRAIYESGTNVNMPHWQSPSKRPDEKRQAVSEHKRSSFIIQRAHEKESTIIVVRIAVFCTDCEKNAWTDTGDPALWDTHTKGEKNEEENRFRSVCQRQRSDGEVSSRNGSLRAMSPLSS